MTPVRTRADRAAFVDFPYTLHRQEPYWVPPLRSDQRRLLDRTAHPFHEFGEVEFLLARRGGRVVGRIAAVHNPRHDDFHGTRDGFFGLFDCVDELGVAEALFGAAEAWLGERGLEGMTGPMTFSTNYECGLLTEGFDLPPAVQMPYNPPYYPELLSGCGFTTAMELLAWELPSTVHEDPKVLRLARPDADRGIRVRPVDLRNFHAEAARIREIYHAAWERNQGFSPMTDREFDAIARELKPFLAPGLGVIAEVAGEPVAVALAVPDVAPALAAAKGGLHTWGIPLGLLRFLRARRALDRVRVLILGVRREHRHRGIELLLGIELSRAAQRLGYPVMEGSWMLADNHAATRAMRFTGARVTKRYRIYWRGPCDAVSRSPAGT
ncbi:hypothetical protein [Streptomyces acidiscabies]|uniref:hypothetical protein n=1 Tax=Streptomyces acidiscabies TaxID=42234 RepID=UPI0038F67374